MLEVVDLGLELFLLGFQEAGFEFGQRGHDRGGLIVPNLLEERCDPGARLGGAATIEVVGHRPEMFVGVPEIQSLYGRGEAVLDQMPNPHGSVGNHQHLPGLTQAALEGLPVKLGDEGLQAQAGGHLATLGNDRALSGRLAPVLQPKDCRHIDPMPAFGFLALLAQGLGLAPVIALADIPGVDFDDQREGLRWGPLGGLGHFLQPLLGVQLRDALGA